MWKTLLIVAGPSCLFNAAKLASFSVGWTTRKKFILPVSLSNTIASMIVLKYGIKEFDTNSVINLTSLTTKNLSLCKI